MIEQRTYTFTHENNEPQNSKSIEKHIASQKVCRIWPQVVLVFVLTLYFMTHRYCFSSLSVQMVFAVVLACGSLNLTFSFGVNTIFNWYGCVWSWSSSISRAKSSIFIYFQYNCVMRWFIECVCVWDMQNERWSKTES